MVDIIDERIQMALQQRLPAVSVPQSRPSRLPDMGTNSTQRPEAGDEAHAENKQASFQEQRLDDAIEFLARVLPVELGRQLVEHHQEGEAMKEWFDRMASVPIPSRFAEDEPPRKQAK